jgi:hypothetical protein
VVQTGFGMTPETAERAPATGFKVMDAPVASLSAVYSAVVATSMVTEGSEGLIRAECPVCNTQFSREELDELAGLNRAGLLESERGKTETPRCGREGCESTEYRIHVLPESEAHWTRIKDRLAQLAPDAREKPVEEVEPSVPVSKQQWAARIAVCMGIVILFFLVRYWYWGAPIPFVHKPNHYEFGLPSDVEAE